MLAEAIVLGSKALRGVNVLGSTVTGISDANMRFKKKQAQPAQPAKPYRKKPAQPAKPAQPTKPYRKKQM